MIPEKQEVRITAPGCAQGHTGFTHWVDSHLYVRTKSGRELGPFQETEVEKFNVLAGGNNGKRTRKN